jgi:hypothetical protein
MITVPFRYVEHLVTVPVTLDKTEATFAFDTGIGVTCLSTTLAKRVGWQPNGSTFTGRRMSGQEISAPLGSVSSLSVGAYRRDDPVVAIFDFGEEAGLGEIQGFVGLDCFRSLAVTFDYPAGEIFIEDADSLAARAQVGMAVPVRPELGEHLVEVFLSLEVSGRRSILVEVDTGSDSLILNQALAAELGVDLSAAGMRRVDGLDETGHTYTRYFGQLAGEVSVSGAAAISQTDPMVMIQEIIYDGLVGDGFLRNFVVTYDLPNSRMIFAATP